MSKLKNAKVTISLKESGKQYIGIYEKTEGNKVIYRSYDGKLKKVPVERIYSMRFEFA